jgi:hypothetical protein
MSQVQTFPFSNLVDPILLQSSRLISSDIPSHISSDSSLPRTKVKTYDGDLYQLIQTQQPNQYYGPEFVIDLPITSSVNNFSDPLTLSVEVKGNPISSFLYQWYKNGSPLVDYITPDGIRTITNTPSGSILHISHVNFLDDHAIYSVRVYNPYNDPTGIGDYAETSTFIDISENLYHPSILFVSVGAIQ